MKHVVRSSCIVLALLIAGCTREPSTNHDSSLNAQSASAPSVPGEVIVKFRPSTALSPLGTINAAGVQLRRVRTLSTEAQLYKTAIPTGQGALELAQALATRLDVVYAHPNYLLEQLATPDDPLYTKQWHYRAINLPAAWDQIKGSSGVRIAVIDSGILPMHPDLAGTFVPGYDFVSDLTASGDGDGRDGDPSDPSGDVHGSHVDGTVAAETNNSVGVAGVSWGSRLLPVRVLGLNGGTLADIIDGVLWSVGQSVPGVPDNANPAQILNLSLGGPFRCSDAPALQDAFDQASTAGATVVVAAGNDDVDASGFAPASCNNVITVGATDLPGARALYSNYGARIDVMAPGGDTTVDTDNNGDVDGVLSTINNLTGNASYDYYQGTSMASPHVAGVAALLKSVRPSLTGAQVEDLLKRSARSISSSSCSVGCGAGLIDAAAALRLAVPATLASYTANFSSTNVPVGRVITSVALGRGVSSSTGKVTADVGITAKRADKSGNVAMVTGSARHLIISLDGRSQTSYAKGGNLNFKLFNFGGVEVKTLRIRGTTTSGGTVMAYRDATLLKRMSVPRTGSGVTTTLNLNVVNATRVMLTLTGPGAVDDLVVVAAR